MDSSDDDDFFCRVGEDPEEFMCFENEESFPPFECMLPPEEEMVTTPEMLEKSELSATLQGTPVTNPESPSASDRESRNTPDTELSASAESSSASPELPIQGGGAIKRQRLKEKSTPSGVWIGVNAAPSIPLHQCRDYAQQ